MRNLKAFGGNPDSQSGVYKIQNYSAIVASGEWYSVAGQQEFLSPGTYSWTCPAGCTAVSAVCIGGGGGGNATWAQSAGGGGGLGWKNNISVTPGQTYTVQVGSGGSRGNSSSAGKGTMSYFINQNTVAGGGGGNNDAGRYADSMQSGRNDNAGGGYTGDGGGRGGSANNYQGGGGAGGYNADGGNYSNNGNASGGSAAGGGYYSSTYGVSAGGGTGIYGKRTDYTPTRNGHGHVNDWSGSKGVAFNSVYNPSTVGGGRGGSNKSGSISGENTGWNGAPGENPWGGGSNSGFWSANANNIRGGFPGGGGGGAGTSWGGGAGANGAVRLIWAGSASGPRNYPDQNVEDVT